MKRFCREDKRSVMINKTMYWWHRSTGNSFLSHMYIELFTLKHQVPLQFFPLPSSLLNDCNASSPYYLFHHFISILPHSVHSWTQPLQCEVAVVCVLHLLHYSMLFYGAAKCSTGHSALHVSVSLIMHHHLCLLHLLKPNATCRYIVGRVNYWTSKWLIPTNPI